MINAALERLLDDMVPFAERSLSLRGAFHPYCGTITPDAEIEHRSVEWEDDQDGGETDTDEAVAILLDSLRISAREGSCLAYALFVDVRMLADDETETDAIHVLLEHVSGTCFNLYIPYRLAADGEIEYGQRVPQPASPTVFVA